MYIAKEFVEFNEVMLSDEVWVELIDIARYQIQNIGGSRFLDFEEMTSISTMWLYGLFDKVLGDREKIKDAMELVWNPLVNPKVVVLGIRWKFVEDVPEEVEEEIERLQEEWFALLEEEGFF